MLRLRLHTASNHVTPEENLAQVAALADEFGHTIVALPSAHDLFGFTCLVHALGFTDRPEYVQVAAHPDHNVFAGAAFAHWLIETGRLQEVPPDEASLGSLVMYFDGGTFRHVGLLRPAGRVESKWGRLGLFEHEPWEVPGNYGSEIKHFKAVDYEVAIQWLYEYAAEQGMEFDEGDAA